MHFDNDNNRRKRDPSRMHKSRRHERTWDGDELAAISRAGRFWYDEAELDAEDAGYEWLAPNSRADLARRRVERYLDQVKLDHDLEDALDEAFDDDWPKPKRGRRRRYARRGAVNDTQ